MTDCCSAAIKFLKAGVAGGQNGRSNLYELVDVGVGLLVEKENKVSNSRSKISMSLNKFHG